MVQHFKSFNLKTLLRFDNLLFAMTLFVLAYVVAPRAWQNLSLQGTEAAPITTLTDIYGQPLSLHGPYALVFWATWCKPCDIELGRIQSMIVDGKIPQDKIIAVSMDTERQTVRNTTLKRQYTFSVVWDSDHSLSSTYKVQGTPTIVVVKENNKVQWATTGLSPLLSLRLQNYLNQK